MEDYNMACFVDNEIMSGNSVRLYDKYEYMNKQNYCTEFPNGGKIVFALPLHSIHIIFYDVNSSKIPNLYDLGYRSITDDRYLRTFICRSGSCEVTLDGKKEKLYSGQVLYDYSANDHGRFSFTSEYFQGVEIIIQLNAFDDDFSVYQMYKPIISAMNNSDNETGSNHSFITYYSSETEKIIDKFINSGFEGEESIVIIAYLVVLGSHLGIDIQNKKSDLTDNHVIIAKDIYDCLTNEFDKKWTAQYFAEKYRLSDSTVKRYFKKVYGFGFKEYQTKVVMENAAKLLTVTDLQISEISDMVGFSTYPMFTSSFKKYYGCSPSDYRNSKRVDNKFIYNS